MYNTSSLVLDMSELAVRLGSIHTFDRTGTVIFFDDFKAGLSNWIEGMYPAAAIPVPTARYHSINPYSIKLKTTTDDGSYSSLQRGFPFPYVSRMGIEFHLKTTSSTDKFLIPSYCYTGALRYILEMEFNKSANAIYLRDADSVQVKVDDYNLQSGSYAPFHIIKIVFDFTTGFYQRLVIDDTDYDVSDISIDNTANTTDAYFYLYFYLGGVGTTSQTVYLDNVIFTIDEPQ
jgi:hypothetical protein